MTTCTRSGCGKTLRDTNTTGMCASNCRSPDAPLSLRAPGVGADELDTGTTKRRGPSDTMRRFRVVATALHKDPDAILEEAAQAWLDVVAKAVE